MIFSRGFKLLFGLALAGVLAACAATGTQTSMGGETAVSDLPKIQPILGTSETANGQPITYPTDTPAEITLALVSLVPGDEITWHEHSIPVAAYVLKGEATIEYKTGEAHVYEVGEGFVEAIDTVHRGINHGDTLVQLVVFFAGAVDVPIIQFVDTPPE